MIPKARLVNQLDMACLIVWFGHLVIPHEWVVLCLCMDDLVHPLVNNFLFPLYLVFLFLFFFWGLMNDVVHIKFY